MAEQMRPASNEQAPDPAHSYERAMPEREAGMGRLDNNKAGPADSPDKITQAVTNKQDSTRQINAQDAGNQRVDFAASGEKPDHSMKDEEPLGWDQAPMDEQDPQVKRHPRTEGKGGTP